MMSIKPFGQERSYHVLVDQRAFLGVPNFLDVVSNLAFVLVGAIGLRFCFKDTLQGACWSWRVFFAGVGLVGLGSAYYHWAPANATLLWDRLPMTIGFMGLFTALLSEHIDCRIEKYLLLPAILAGFASVIYWYCFDDLRFYAGIQSISLLTVPLVLFLFRGRYTRRMLLLVALFAYVLAKVAEMYDREVFAFTRQHLSGHTLKHLLAALACFAVYAMLKARKPLNA